MAGWVRRQEESHNQNGEGKGRENTTGIQSKVWRQENKGVRDKAGRQQGVACPPTERHQRTTVPAMC